MKTKIGRRHRFKLTPTENTPQRCKRFIQQSEENKENNSSPTCSFVMISPTIDQDQTNETEEASNTSSNEQSNFIGSSHLPASTNLNVSSYVYAPSNLPTHQTLPSSTTSNVFQELKLYVNIIVQQRQELQQELVNQREQMQQELVKQREQMQQELVNQREQMQQELVKREQMQQELVNQREQLQEELVKQREQMQQELVTQRQQLQEQIVRLTSDMNKQRQTYEKLLSQHQTFNESFKNSTSQ